MWKKKISAAVAALAVAVVIGGCAHPQLVDPGTPESAIVEELGAPDARVPLAEGGARLVYSMQPMDQAVWWLTLDAGGRLVSKENVLDRKHFALVKPGVSTREDVRKLFGHCAEEYEFSLKNETAWMYRFLDDGMFYMAFWVQFDTKDVVTETGYTTDPWRDRDGWFPF